MQVASKNSLVLRALTPVATGLLVTATVLLAGCGQKGALRLAPAPAVVPSAASAPVR